jgi:hypothetical protein
MQRFAITLFNPNGSIWRVVPDPRTWNIDERGILYITIGPEGSSEIITTTLPFAIQHFSH